MTPTDMFHAYINVAIIGAVFGGCGYILLTPTPGLLKQQLYAGLQSFGYIALIGAVLVGFFEPDTTTGTYLRGLATYGAAFLLGHLAAVTAAHFVHRYMHARGLVFLRY